MTPAIEITGLSKRFRVAAARGPRRASAVDPRRRPLNRRHDLFHALRQVSFTVAQGRTLGLVGPNGSGKSTLLKILGGVMQADAGTIRMTGRVGALLELGAGFHPDLSGIDNVYLNGALLGIPGREIDRLLPEIIRFAELERFMDLPVKHFSSGMTARLGFALAAQLAPDILLMDETFATGDARFQARALGRISEMKGQGRTMILVSHNLDMLLQLADEVLWLEQGAVRAIGPAREILVEYRERGHARLFGSDQMLARLGLEGLFQPLAPPGAAPVRIERVAWAEPAADGGATARVAPGGVLALRIALRHEGDHPARVRLELAWQRRRDGLVLGQTRCEVELEPGGATERTLVFRDWLLEEGHWNLAAAVAPAGEPRPVFYDRLLDAGQVEVQTPAPLELPAAARIPARWEVAEN